MKTFTTSTRVDSIVELLQETCTKASFPGIFGKTVTLPMLLKSEILTPGKATMSIEYMVSVRSKSSEEFAQLCD